MIEYELGILIAILSYVYTNLLTEPNMVFNKLYIWCDSWMPRWLFYPFIHCEKCNAGQISLFTYIYNYWIGFYFYPIETIGTMFLFIAFTIFTTYTIKQIWQRI